VLRLFYALQPSRDECDVVAALTHEDVASFSKQPIAPANFHFTLSFVGAVEPERLAALVAAADGVRAAPIELECDALDYWPEPRILCVTARASRGGEELPRMLGDAATAAGFAPDTKPFRPHLTVGRKVTASLAKESVWPRSLARVVPLRFDHFVLMESRRGERGSDYHVLRSWPLHI
jgi:RNA 2',3'-cyclic 3'-phosphodiesterase